jgi:hypothetical protein
MKKIKFIPNDKLTESIIPSPTPASNFLPNWYKKLDKHINKNLKTFKISENKNDSNLTVKKCVPFFDTLTNGYIVTLPCDIIFVDPNQHNGMRIIWKTSFNPIDSHSEKQVEGMPSLESKNSLWKWNFNFIIKTPPGYSCYFSHPKYRFDLPFFTLDGIVDTDKHIIPISFPFLINQNFMGKIRMGTPICNIFPYKRENWKMVIEKYKESNRFMEENFNLMAENSYKLRFWNRKKFI